MIPSRPRSSQRARPPRSGGPDQPQLDFTAMPTPSARDPGRRDADQWAKAAAARRTKPSAVPAHVELALTLDVPRELVERLRARAIREEKNLEAVVIEILDRAMR